MNQKLINKANLVEVLKEAFPNAQQYATIKLFRDETTKKKMMMLVDENDMSICPLSEAVVIKRAIDSCGSAYHDAMRNQNAGEGVQFTVAVMDDETEEEMIEAGHKWMAERIASGKPLPGDVE